MPYRPIQWARRSVEGRQVEADGSRLLNFYAIQVQAPQAQSVPKVPVMLYSSPGVRRYLEVPNPDNNTNQTAGFHALLEVKSPIYGHRIFGLAHRYEFFHARYDAAPAEIPDDYDPFADGASAYAVPAGNIVQFTTNQSDSIPAGRKAKMVTDGRVILWVTPREVYAYDLGKTGGAGFVAISAPVPADLSTLEDLADQEWVDCAWVDGYFLLAARSGQFFHSNNYSTTFDQLDFADAGSNPDEIVGLEVLNRRIFILGSQSIEQWFNAGLADFAFARDNSFTVNIGCSAKDTIIKNEFSIIFLGSNLIVYVMNSGGVQRISAESVEYDIARSDVAKAHAWNYTEEGHLFYILTLDIDGTDKTWVYDFNVQVWHERSLHDVRVALQLSNGRTIIGRDGAEHIFDQRLDWGVIEADDDTATDIAIDRLAICSVLFANFQRISMISFQIDIPLRPDGEDTDYVQIEWNDTGDLDNEDNWVGGTLRDGTTIKKFILDDGPRFFIRRLGQFRDGRNMRLKTSANRRVDVLGAYVEIDVAPD